jgi:hypothetical protein
MKPLNRGCPEGRMRGCGCGYRKNKAELRAIGTVLGSRGQVFNRDLHMLRGIGGAGTRLAVNSERHVLAFAGQVSSRLEYRVPSQSIAEIPVAPEI